MEASSSPTESRTLAQALCSGDGDAVDSRQVRRMPSPLPGRAGDSPRFATKGRGHRGKLTSDGGPMRSQTKILSKALIAMLIVPACASSGDGPASGSGGTGGMANGTGGSGGRASGSGGSATGSGG